MAVPTFVAGAVLTAAQLNTISTALTITDAWTGFTPSLTQSVTVTKTVTYARYIKVGRMVTVSWRLDITGAGTAANAIVVGLPAPVPVVGVDHPMGSGWFFDTSGGDIHSFEVVVASTTTTKLLTVGVGVDVAHLGTIALASGDALLATFTYESTT